MISKTFKKLAVGLSLTAAMMSVSAPALADKHFAPEDKAKVTISIDDGIRILDFSNSSRDCLEYFASGASKRSLLLVAESDAASWRNATLDAAKMLKSDGKSVAVVYGNDQDGLDTTATTIAWANGVKRSQASASLKDGFTYSGIVATSDKVVDYIHQVGSEVWDSYLKVPNKIPDLAYNNE